MVILIGISGGNGQGWHLMTLVIPLWQWCPALR